MKILLIALLTISTTAYADRNTDKNISGATIYIKQFPTELLAQSKAMRYLGIRLGHIKRNHPTTINGATCRRVKAKKQGVRSSVTYCKIK